MALLVTGGAGYIGSHVAKLLDHKKREIVIFDNLSEGFKEALHWGAFWEGDLRNPEDIDRVFDHYEIDSVLHFAACALVGESVHNPKFYYENNFIGSYNLINACIAHKVKHFIFSSTCAVYGQPDRVPIVETEPKRPISPYGKTKSMVEELLKDYSGISPMRYVAFRYFNAAGADKDVQLGEKHTPETHIIPVVLNAAASNTPFTVFGTDYETPDGTCVRDFIHVEDLAEAHVRGLEYLEAGKSSQIFNLGGGKGKSVFEIIASAEKIIGKKIPHSIGPRREGDPAHLIGDFGKARELLGWTPERSDTDTLISSAWRWRNSKAYASFIEH